jgi:nucleotidyltransferase/DNA polymerase involved in DNA repair
MPGFIGKKLCPDLIFIKEEFDKYKAVSDIVKNIMLEYDSNQINHSLDEFYLDLTDICKLRQQEQLLPVTHPVNQLSTSISNEDSENEDEEDYLFAQQQYFFSLHQMGGKVAQEIREKIRQATGGLTSSAGIAPNFMLAKIAADVKKPDGQYCIPPNRGVIITFLDSLPCRKVGGIGRVTEKILSELDMHTMGDVRRRIGIVRCGLSGTIVSFLMRASLGISSEETEKRDGSMQVVFQSSLDSGPVIASEDSSCSNNESMVSHSMDNRTNNTHMPVLTEMGCTNAMPGHKRTLNEEISHPSADNKHHDLERKSIGYERTFEPMRDIPVLMGKLMDICKELSCDLVAKGVWAYTLTLKIKSVNFQVTTRRHTINCTQLLSSKKQRRDIITGGGGGGGAQIFTPPNHTPPSSSSANTGGGSAIMLFQSQSSLFEIASELLLSLLPVNIRLMGVQVSKLSRSPTPHTLPPPSSFEQTPLGAMFRKMRKERECGERIADSRGEMVGGGRDEVSTIEGI